MAKEEIMQSLRLMERILMKAHDDITGVADSMEEGLTTEEEMSSSKEYGIACRTLGILEERIEIISNQLTKLNSYEKGES